MFIVEDLRRELRIARAAITRIEKLMCTCGHPFVLHTDHDNDEGRGCVSVLKPGTSEPLGHECPCPVFVLREG